MSHLQDMRKKDAQKTTEKRL